MLKGRILATGGAGYIGSHLTVELLAAGYEVVILDNFENSDRATVNRIPKLAHGPVTLVEGDVRNCGLVETVLRRHRIDAVVHLAGKKAVGESVRDPLRYFNDNLMGAVSLFRAMRAVQVNNLLFSSSATVYGTPDQLPIRETAPTSISNPYGRTKLMTEEIIDDMVAAYPAMKAISLRYFNPVGAHASGQIGENPRGVPNNLFPYVAQTAAGLRSAVEVYGNDYATEDGTGLRDYIHVVDLAQGHVAAMAHLLSPAEGHVRHRRINLGTGKGHTVLQVIKAFSQACGFNVPYRIVPRRPGDAAASLADATLAQQLLDWRARHSLAEMCRDQWLFQKGVVQAKPLGGVVLRFPQALDPAAMLGSGSAVEHRSSPERAAPV